MAFTKGFTISVILLIGFYTLCVLSLEPAKCKGKEIKLSEKDSTTFSDCMMEISGSKDFKDIPKEKMPCIGKCILMKRGLVDELGMPAKENVIGMINATMPAEVIDELDTKIGKCMDDFGKVMPDEETCKSYQPMTECIMKAIMDVCKEDPKSS